MDIVETMFKTLCPATEDPKPQSQSNGEFITKDELENIAAKITESVESKMTAMFEKLATPAPQPQPEVADTHPEGSGEDKEN